MTSDSTAPPREPWDDVPMTERLLCRLPQLSSTGCREFRLGVGDWPLRGFVIRTGEHVRAFVNRCPHVGYRLNFLPDDFLTADGRHVLCAMHGAIFERDSGLCVGGPCLGRYLTPLPIEIDGEQVLLAADADLRALIERFA